MSLKSQLTNSLKMFIFSVGKSNQKLGLIFSNLALGFSGTPVRVRCLEDSTSEARFYIKDKRDGSEVVIANLTRVFHYTMGVKGRLDKIAKYYFLDHVEFREGDVVIDVGANIGELGLYLKSKSVKYHAFEPARAEFAALSKNIVGSELINKGCWEFDGNLKFYSVSASADSSFIEPAKPVEETFDVEVVKLESVLSGPVRLLKLDGEGGEPEILQGAGKLLAMTDYVSVDVGYERGPREESTFLPVLNLMLEAGFDLIQLETRTRFAALFKRKGAN